MRFFIIPLFVGFLTLLFASENSGFIKNLKGEATILRNSSIIPIELGTKVFEKDIIETKKGSSLGIIFKDNTLISLGSNTKFKIEKYTFIPAEKKTSFIGEIVKGTMTCLTGLISKLNPEAMEIKAKSASIGIRGTHFAISVD